MDADADQLQLYIFILERVSLHLLAKQVGGATWEVLLINFITMAI